MRKKQEEMDRIQRKEDTERAQREKTAAIQE